MVNRKVDPILYLDLSSIGKYTAQKKRQQIGFRVREKLLYFLGELLFEEIVGYDASVSVSVQLCKHALSEPS